MLRSIFLLSLFISAQAFSATCYVKYYKDAIKCIETHAMENYGEGEIENSAGVTRFDSGKQAFKQITGIEAKTRFVGVVEVHEDEDQLYYYTIPRGVNVEPVMVKHINIVDIDYEVPDLEDYSREDLLKLLSLDIPLTGSMSTFH